MPSSDRESANILKELKTKTDCDTAHIADKSDDDKNRAEVPDESSAHGLTDAENTQCKDGGDSSPGDCFEKNIPTDEHANNVVKGNRLESNSRSLGTTLENKNKKHNFNNTDRKYDVNSNLPSDMKGLSFAKLPPGGTCINDSPTAKNITKHKDQKEFVLSFSDSSIRSNIHKSGCSHMNLRDECPNVSLSPLIEKQISPFSGSSKVHMCATRKISVDSCDDDDLPPAIAANILIVSHGGFLRELLRYFIDELDTAVPGGKAQAFRTCPNTGISRFTVSIQSTDDKIRVTCLEIHDKDHLNSQYL